MTALAEGVVQLRDLTKEKLDLIVMCAIARTPGVVTSRLVCEQLHIGMRTTIRGKSQTISNVLYDLGQEGNLSKERLAIPDGQGSQYQFTLTKKGIEIMQQNGLANSPGLMALANKATPAPVLEKRVDAAIIKSSDERFTKAEGILKMGALVSEARASLAIQEGTLARLVEEIERAEVAARGAVDRLEAARTVIAQQEATLKERVAEVANLTYEMGVMRLELEELRVPRCSAEEEAMLASFNLRPGT